MLQGYLAVCQDGRKNRKHEDEKIEPIMKVMLKGTKIDLIIGLNTVLKKLKEKYQQF